MLTKIIKFLLDLFDLNATKSKQKRWANASKIERDIYRKKYNNSPPGWEWE